MIGSHDTFTYLKPKNRLYRAISGTWKTQCKSIKQQYNAGVRMFDIRVVKSGKYWVPAHGLANLKGREWGTLGDICLEMKRYYPEAIYRIVLERGDDKEFRQESTSLCDDFANLWRIIVKSTKNWKGIYNNDQNLYERGYLFAKNNTWEAPSYEIHGTTGLKSLKSQAKELNKTIPDSPSNDKNELYLIDYCTKEYD